MTRSRTGCRPTGLIPLYLLILGGWVTPAPAQTPTTVGTAYPPTTHFPYATPESSGETGAALAPLTHLVTAWADPRHDLIVVYFTQSRGGRTTRRVVPMVMGALGLQP
jgi:hypothetical protein